MDNSTQIFEAMKGRFKQAMSSLPIVIGNEVVNFSKERFAEQNWNDKTKEPWDKRKSKKDAGRAILVKSGRLKRSPRVISTTADSVTVGSDVPYAQVHNDGFNGTVNVKSFQRNKYNSRKAGSGKLNKSGSERMQTISTVSGVGTVKAHTRQMNMPRRRFLGTSENMMQRLKRIAAIHLLKSLQ